MAKRPAVPIAIAFTAGVLLAGAGPKASGWLYLLAALLFGAGLSVRKRFPILPFLLIIAVLGWVRCSTYTHVAEDDISHFSWEKIAGFEGIIASDPDVRENRTYIVVRADRIVKNDAQISVSGNVMVTVYAPERKTLQYGERAFIRSGLKPPMQATNPGEFSWGEYLARQRIYSTASVKHQEDMETISRSAGNPIISACYGVKRWFQSGIDQMYPNTEGQLVKGVLLGSYAELDDNLVTAFSRSGTLHLLAASGFNCMVLITVFGLLLTYLPKADKTRRNIILFCLLILYLLVIGPKPSILRATVMASLALLAYPLKRSADPANILFSAVLIILAIRPTDLFDVGFQLSFAAVAAIMGILPPLNLIFQRLGWTPSPVKKSQEPMTKAKNWICRNTMLALVSTISATLGTAPLIAHYFNYISLISPIANVAVAAAIEPVFSFGLAAPFIKSIPIISDLTAIFGRQLAHFVLSSVNYLGSLPKAAIPVVSPGFLTICGYYILLYGLFSYASERLSRK